MIKFRCDDRIIEWNGKPYSFSRRLNNRWYFLFVLAINTDRYGGTTSLEQLREISLFRSRNLGRQIAAWLKHDSRVQELAGCESPTKGPYFLKDRIVEILGGESIFRELGLAIGPARPEWSKLRRHLEGYVKALALFQKGKIVKAVEKCNELIPKADLGIRFECGLLLACSYAALGFFEPAKRALADCKPVLVEREFRARVKIVEARIDYFAERFSDARCALDAPALRKLPWFSHADWFEMSALLEGREYKRLWNQLDAAGVPAEKRQLRKLALESFRHAEKHLEQALSLRLLHGDPHGLQATCFNLGNLIWKRRPGEGRNWIDTSEEICELWGVGQNTILPKFVLARIDLHDGKPVDAWARAQKAFADAHQRDNVFDRATGHRQHARYYLTGKTDEDRQKALPHLWICYKIYTTLNLQDSMDALDRDFPGKVSESKQAFGTDLKGACQGCALLPIFAGPPRNQQLRQVSQRPAHLVSRILRPASPFES